MRIIHTDDYEAMSKKSAAIVASQIILKPDSVLGLATGSTPLDMYKELIRLHREVGLDFSEVITYNLDEYVGIPRNDENSYHYYMYENFFNHINIKEENINLPDGNALDSERECIEFENKIRASGGLDLQVLGIGNNGHIGFNEPDLKFEATTHLVTLDAETRIANSRFFESIDKVPTLAISMGIRTIMNAKKYFS